MNILIAGSIIGDYGIEEKYFVETLEMILRDKGHRVDSFNLPFERDMLFIGEQCVAYNLIDASEADMLITIGFPAALIPHPNKKVFLFDLIPAFNEYWDSEYGVISSPRYNRQRHSTFLAEKDMLGSAKEIYVCSENLQNDIKMKHGEDVGLYRPLYLRSDKNINELLNVNEPFFIMETSLLPHQRVELALDALKMTQGYELCIFVPNTQNVYWETTQKHIDEMGLTDRVHLISGIASNNHIKQATGYLAIDYDSRRLPSICGSLLNANCPIIALEDSGAIAELVLELCKNKLISSDASDIANEMKAIHGLTKKPYKESIEFMQSLNRFAEGLVK